MLGMGSGCPRQGRVPTLGRKVSLITSGSKATNQFFRARGGRGRGRGMGQQSPGAKEH